MSEVIKQLNITAKSYWIYSILALLIMGLMWLPGYILTLDMVFAPRLPAPTGISSDYLIRWLLHVLSLIVPPQIIQKLLIFGILLLAGMGMYQLMRARLAAKTIQEEVGCLIAGTLYVMNPFTYERWMAGHYLLLAGYALLPWFVRALLQLLEQPGWRSACKALLWLTVIGLVSVHMLVMALLLTLVMGAVFAMTRRQQKRYLAKLLGNGLTMAAGFAVLNGYWLLSVLSGRSTLTKAITTFDELHLEAFTTAAHPTMGLLVNVASLHGFWLERFNRFGRANANLVLWLIALAVLVLVMGAGVQYAWRQRRTETAAFLAIGLLAFLLACGIHAPGWGGVTEWLLTRVPPLQGFREPAKFSALLALAYCYFAAFGVAILSRRLKTLKRLTVMPLTAAWLLLPLALTPTMPLAFGGQLKPVWYPASWYAWNQRLQAEPQNFKVLFLPWHQYMSFDFSPRIIANPAPQFFQVPVIAGDNAEFGEVFRDTNNPDSDFIERQILTRPADVGMRLAERDIKYVLLADGENADQYTWLDDRPQLERLSREPGLTVYRNKEFIDGP